MMGEAIQIIRHCHCHMRVSGDCYGSMSGQVLTPDIGGEGQGRFSREACM